MLTSRLGLRGATCFVLAAAVFMTMLPGEPAHASRVVKVTVTPENIFSDIEPSFIDALRLKGLADRLKEMNRRSRERLSAAIEREYRCRDNSSAVEGMKRRHYLALIGRASSGLALKLKYIASMLSSSQGRLLLGYTTSHERRWVLLIERDSRRPVKKMDVTDLATEETLGILAKYADRKWTTFVDADQVDAAPEIGVVEAFEVVKRSKALQDALKGAEFLDDPRYDRLCLSILGECDRLAKATKR